MVVVVAGCGAEVVVFFRPEEFAVIVFICKMENGSRIKQDGTRRKWMVEPDGVYF